MRLSDHPDINWRLQTPASSYGKGSHFDTDSLSDDAVLIGASPAPASPFERQLINLRIKLNDTETTCQISVKTKSLEWLVAFLSDKTGRAIKDIQNLEILHKTNP